MKKVSYVLWGKLFLFSSHLFTFHSYDVAVSVSSSLLKMLPFSDVADSYCVSCPIRGRKNMNVDGCMLSEGLESKTVPGTALVL